MGDTFKYMWILQVSKKQLILLLRGGDYCICCFDCNPSIIYNLKLSINRFNFKIFLSCF